MFVSKIFYALVLLGFVNISVQFNARCLLNTAVYKQKKPLTSSHILMNRDIDGDENEGYGPVGSLLRQGPVPYFIRIVNPSTYDAAVNKYMALEKCNKLVAQVKNYIYFNKINRNILLTSF